MYSFNAGDSAFYRVVVFTWMLPDTPPECKKPGDEVMTDLMKSVYLNNQHPEDRLSENQSSKSRPALADASGHTHVTRVEARRAAIAAT